MPCSPAGSPVVSAGASWAGVSAGTDIQPAGAPMVPGATAFQQVE
jgi:hypothetical protein